MSDIILQKVSRKDLDRAQTLYLGGQELSTICHVLKIEPETLRFYVFGLSGNGTEKDCWHGMKKNLKGGALALYLADKASVLEGTAGIALEIVTHSLSTIRDELISGARDPLTIDEISKIAKISVDLDKTYRLETGTATDLIEHIGLSRAEAKEILANDPFAQSVDVEYKELPWLSNDK